MLVYKIDVVQALREAGYNQWRVRNEKIFSQSTMKKFKSGDTNLNLDNINRLCYILEMQPRDIIKFVETEEDRKVFEP